MLLVPHKLSHTPHLPLSLSQACQTAARRLVRSTAATDARHAGLRPIAWTVSLVGIGMPGGESGYGGGVDQPAAALGCGFHERCATREIREIREIRPATPMLHHAMPHHQRASCVASLSFPPRVLRANNDEITLLGANLSFQMLVHCAPYGPSHLK